jgi:RimJ/RimL family protein N-acetyltransferase
LAPAVIFLETPRLLFRSHQADDEEDFVQMQTDPEVRRYVGGKAWPREKAVYRFRNEYLGKPSKTYGLWATILKSESKYIGYCGLHRAEESVRLGYYISRPYWRRGLATEASQAFLDVAFSQLQLAEVFADVEKGHDVSEHILQKLGFTFVDQEELPGRILHIYRLPRVNPRS